MKNILITIAAVLLVGCTSLYTNTVTLTKIRDSAMKELAVLHAQGKISADVDAKITKADLAYRQAAGVAQQALIAYKNGGSSTDYTATLQSVRVALSGVLDILSQFITTPEATAYKTQLVNAVKL